MARDVVRGSALAVVVSLIAGCGGTSPGSPSPPPAQTASATGSPAPAQPTGSPAAATPVAPSAVILAPSPASSRAAAHIVARIPIPGNPNGLLDAFGSVWVSSRHTNAVYRIDPNTNATSATITIAQEPSYFVSDGTAVWVVESGANVMARIDPATNKVEAVLLGPAEYDSPQPVFAGGGVWDGTEAPSVVKVDAQTHKVVGTISLPGVGATVASEPDLVAAGGLLWVFRRRGSGDITGIRRYDPVTLELVDTISAPPGKTFDVFGLGADDGAVWTRAGGPILKLDAVTGETLASFAGPYNAFVQLTGGHLWQTITHPEAFGPIDMGTGIAGAEQALPGTGTEVLWILDRGPHDLWIADWDNNVVYRVDPAP